MFYPKIVTIDLGNSTKRFLVTDVVEEWRLHKWQAISPEKESNLLAHLLSEIKTGDVFYDIGAGIGLYTIFAASRGVQVLAFEPDKRYRTLLRLNLLLNPSHSDVEIAKQAISNKNSQMYLVRHRSRPFSSQSISQYLGHGQIGKKVPVLSLDSYVYDYDKRIPTIIRISVQGEEVRAIAGMWLCLRSESKPRLVYIEVHNSENILPIKITMRKHGYTGKQIQERGSQSQWVFSQ